MSDERTAKEGADPEAEDAQSRPAPERLSVWWVAAAETLQLCGRILGPLAVGLSDEFVDIALAYPAGGDPNGLPSPPIELIEHEPMRWGFTRKGALSALEGRVTSAKVDLVHALDSASAPLARRLASKVGCEHVATAWSLGDSRHLGIMHHRPSAVLAVDRAVADDLRRHHFSPSDCLEVIRPGVHQVRRPTCFTEPGRIATIILSGPRDDSHAFATALQSFKHLRELEYDCVYFIIVGGRAERGLRRQAEKLGLRHDVTFVDRKPMSRLPGIFKAGDVFISAASRRRVDVHALLAMAAGVPVLAADRAVGQFITHEGNCISFDPDDAEALAEKLACLLSDHAAATSLAERALAYLREHHTPAGMVSAHADLYRRVVARGRHAATNQPAEPPAARIA